MSTITYQNIENDSPASANVLNERFGQIVNEINGNLDSSNIKDGAITLAKVSSEIYEKMYPIGSVYINASVDTNPGTLLGFGTWEAYGKGRVLVGKADSGTFASAGSETGEETHTLTLAESPTHSHSGTTNNAGNHSHSYNRDLVVTSGSGSARTYAFGNGQQLAWSAASMSTNGDHWHSFGTNAQGGGQAHNNIQPSVVVYMWRRTG